MEKYHGIIVDESFRDESYIKQQKIIGSKKSSRNNWMLYKTEVDPERILDVIKLTQNELKTDLFYYAHFYRTDELIVVFKEKIFELDPHDKNSWKECINYGVKKQIPFYQMEIFPVKKEDEDY